MTQVGTQCGWWREAGGTWSLSEALSCTPLTPSLPTWLHRRHRGHAQRHQWGRDGPTLAGVGGAPSPQPHLSPHPRPHPPKTARTPRPTCGLYPLQPLEPPTPGPWPFWDSSPCSAPPPPPCSTPTREERASPLLHTWAPRAQREAAKVVQGEGVWKWPFWEPRAGL